MEGKSNQEAAIFIGGTGRSGTTLMTRMLNQHREVVAFSETQLVEWRIFREFPQWISECPIDQRDCLLGVFKRLCLTRFYHCRVGHRMNLLSLATWKTWDRVWTPRFYHLRSLWCQNPVLEWLEEVWLSEAMQSRTFPGRMPDDRSAWEDFGMRGLYGFFDRGEVQQCISGLDHLTTVGTLEEAYEVYGQTWRSLFGMCAQKRGKRKWAEKTPANALYVPFLKRCFGNLRFIHMIRDGRDVACSMLEQPWRVRRAKGAIDQWGTRLTRALQNIDELPSGQHLNVRYEDLILKTEPTLRRVAEFLDIEWDRAMLAQSVYQTSIGRYQSGLSSQAQEYAMDKWGDLLSSWGYQ